VADGKWIGDLQPDTPLLDAARHVLYVRLQVVREYLPLVLHHADDDPEYIHQLRVGTRRADAALRIFRSCLPDKVYRAGRDRLRTLRRAAGAARDWDVFVLALRERLQRVEEGDHAGLDFLVGYALGQRIPAVKQLQAAGEKQSADFEQFITDTIGALRLAHDENNPTLLDLARTTLTALRQELEQTAAGDLSDYPQLHQVRIAGKRLRYAMEVFADCFGESFKEELYPMVEDMQEILGRANDSHVAGERLQDLRAWLKQRLPGEWKRLQPGVEGLLRFHQRRLPQERRRFLQWWERWSKHGSEGLLATLFVTAPP